MSPLLLLHPLARNIARGLGHRGVVRRVFFYCLVVGLQVQLPKGSMILTKKKVIDHSIHLETIKGYSIVDPCDAPRGIVSKASWHMPCPRQSGKSLTHKWCRRAPYVG